ncbi:fibronectin type III domain-containing protein [bacterium]|jgi:hypothetical protein|nr:fibronectin type III domain-containing protein [bacterium]MBT6293875.1 fibronectin type III domain-containing protein [bacterium]
MNFKLTHFIFIFSFFALLNLNQSLALDLFVKDSYVSSKVKYTLSNDKALNDINLVLTDAKGTDYLISNVNSINLQNSSYEAYMSQIYFNKAGKYKLSAYQNDSIIASDTFNVSIYNPFNSKAIGGDDTQETANLIANNSQVVDEDEPLLGIENPRFEISDFEELINVDEFLTFTVQALDSDSNNNQEYVGTLNFEVIDDENVTLPDPYEFEIDDAGRHTFSSSISFSTPGDKIIRLFDSQDSSLEAAFEINVKPSASNQENQDSNANINISLDSPSSGISNINTIEFIGKTSPGKEVKLFENDSLLISLGSDGEGNFQFISPPFADGDYEFYAEIDGVKSNIVELEIITESAILNDFVIAPESVRPLKKFNLELTFSDRVSNASVIIDGKKFDLENVDDASSKFFGELVSPVLSGEYNISVIYVDFQGASNTFLIPEKLFVLPPELPNTNETEEIDFNVNPNSLDSDLDLQVENSNSSNNNFVSDAIFIPPSNVAGVSTVSDSSKVQLNWLPANDNTGVSFYLIRFGLDPANLNSEIRTFDSTNAFTIEQLQNDLQYYFTIFAVDLDGNLSRQGSNLVSAVTSRSVTSSFGLNVDSYGLDSNQILDSDFIQNNGLDSSQDLQSLETSNVGPSENIALLCLMLSFVLGVIVRRKGWLWF